MRPYVLSLLLFFVGLLPGQETVSLRGRVVDSRTGGPLVGVNVMVKGTYHGSSTDIDGYYSISGITTGDYDLQVSYIGYKLIQKNGIALVVGTELVEDFALEVTALSFGRDIVIIGKKPLFDVSITASSTKISRSDLEAMIVDDIVDILSNSGGVSTTDNEVHVRGGRLDETLFIIDGVATRDPLTGYSANLYINADAIEEMEILTGGFNAEYGQAMSGVVNVKLKEGREELEGSFKYTSDDIGLAENYSTRRLEFNLGGQSLLERGIEKLGLSIPGRFFFFLNGYGKVSKTNLPAADRLYPHLNFRAPGGLVSQQSLQRLIEQLAPGEENDWHTMFKSTWRINPRIQWSQTFDFSMNINQAYFMPRAFSKTYFPYRFIEILDNYNTITRTALMVNSIFIHTLSPRSFYEVKVARFSTAEHSAVQDLHWSEYRERLDLEPKYFNPSSQDGDIKIDYRDGKYDAGMSPEWYDTQSDNNLIKGDWTYSFSDRQRLKSGFEGNWTTIQVVDIDEPWTGTTGLGVNFDIYRVRTHNGSFYIQDNLTFEGMIVNLGLRYDYWIPGADLETAINDTTRAVGIDLAEARQKFERESFNFLGHRVKSYLSPRLGISHPVTDNDVLYFYFGHFSQQPTYQYVFAKIKSNSQGTYQIMGNPTLNPKTTVQYEIGVKHRFNEDQILELKAYWKNMYNYETSQTVISENPRLSKQRYNMYFNADYARSRGVEAVLRMRLWRNFSTDGSFSYSIATGKSSNPDDNQLVQAGALSEKPLGENFLAWDRPLRIFLNFSYYRPPGQSGWPWLHDWGAAFRLDYESGRRYTSMTLLESPDTTGLPLGQREKNGTIYYWGTRNSDTPYDRVGKQPRFIVDCRLYKNWNLGGTRLRLLFEVENLFNARIPRRINPFTGEGFDEGEYFSYDLIDNPNPNEDPSRFEKPRMVELGLQVYF